MAKTPWFGKQDFPPISKDAMVRVWVITDSTKPEESESDVARTAQWFWKWPSEGPGIGDIVAYELVEHEDHKHSNPKDRIGSKKLPLDLTPDTMKAYATLGYLEGALKYGACNWRVAGVRASIYKAAAERHLMKWWNGEDEDATTGVPHLASVLACIGIILDAGLVGKLTDDRPPKADLAGLVNGFETKVVHLQELFKDHHPHHHTAEDGKARD